MNKTEVNWVFQYIERNLKDAWVYRWANKVDKQVTYFKNELANTIDQIIWYKVQLINHWYNDKYIIALNTLKSEIESWKWNVGKISSFLETREWQYL